MIHLEGVNHIWKNRWCQTHTWLSAQTVSSCDYKSETNFPRVSTEIGSNSSFLSTKRVSKSVNEKNVTTGLLDLSLITIENSRFGFLPVDESYIIAYVNLISTTASVAILQREASNSSITDVKLAGRAGWLQRIHLNP